MKDIYYRLITYNKNKYGAKVQRIPINAGFTCPNKTGEKGKGGCIFCDSTGSGFASLSSKTPINDQLNAMIERYNGRANMFMAYFQSNTNTYAPVHVLKKLYDSSLIDDRIKILDISTRPDCVSNDVLDLIASYKEKLDVFLEFGAESFNTNTLKLMNRGHTVSETLDAVLRAHKRKLDVVLHFILDFPTDTMEDIIEMAEISSILGVHGVKLHSLYIAENTKLGEMYKNDDFKPLTLNDYIERVITFLEHLSPNIVIHRLVSEPPKEGCLFGLWGLKKMKVFNMIENEMKKRNTYQGRLYKF
ncbi:TIGR01212 family radical SAM protein [Tepiditoga spiralis]|uniref:TIGR01212 family radical SAM protein n=1 Tax=Tepiditoga spiralis TaxID=2108365 RepID=A0A7G1GBA0_9BACT|nr:TIGR01212 family radical SAM protein [Tepiditoga spiralis]BBE30929.1 TIGR01212 family radical SAM protein [Tepiditoga spiralis]